MKDCLSGGTNAGSGGVIEKYLAFSFACSCSAFLFSLVQSAFALSLPFVSSLLNQQAIRLI